ncbi:MAG: hypothetical protein ACR2M5_13895 [Nakamurella sp.]
MAVSIPEKTLAHWASTYILHRYHTKVPLWWPTSRADVEVGDLGYQAGKAFWLELKTATWNPSKATHVVKVDLWQLWKYSQQHIPVYYAFPIPQWSDTMTSPAGKAWLGGMQRSNLAFWRGAPKTFYRWMVVVPGWELFAYYSATISALQSKGTFKTSSASVLAVVEDGTRNWNWNSKIRPGPTTLWPWLDFWRQMDQCGGPEMPAIMMVDGSMDLSLNGTCLRSVLVEKLHRAPTGDLDRVWLYAPAPTEEPTDAYRPIEDADLTTDSIGPDGDDRPSSDSVSRVLITIPSSRLRR